MNEVEVIENGKQLPNTIEDISQYVIAGEAALRVVKDRIKAIDDTKVAKEVYDQKLQEAQEVGKLVVEAGAKLGELLLRIPKGSGHYEEEIA